MSSSNHKGYGFNETEFNDQDHKFPIMLPEPSPPRSSQLRHWVKILDIFLIIVTISFIVFAFLVLFYDGQPISRGTISETLLEVASYGPTIFPVVFAAIVGRTLKSIATWKLQEGTTIGRVEQLVGSSTIIGSVVTQFQIRHFDWVAIGIIVLWSLSPLGGQAALRTVYADGMVSLSNYSMTFLDPRQAWRYGASVHEDLSYKSVLTSLFTSALLRVDVMENKTQDDLGNLRIPMIEHYDGYEDGHWIDIHNTTETKVFSALVGIPFDPQPPTIGVSTFVINASYLSLTCSEFGLHNHSEVGGSWTNFHNGDWTSLGTYGTPPDSPTGWYSSVYPRGSLAPTMYNGFQVAVTNCTRGCGCRTKIPTEANFTECSWDIFDLDMPWEGRKFLWESNDEWLTIGDEPSLLRSLCDMRTTYVNVRYECSQASSCNVAALRLSPAMSSEKQEEAHRNQTALDAGYSATIYGFLESITNTLPAIDSYTHSPLENYLVSPTNALLYTGKINITMGGKRVFETRMSQILNTLYIIGISPMTVAGKIPASDAEYFASNGSMKVLLTSSVTATTSSKTEVIHCSKLWLVILLIASIVLSIIAVLGTVFRVLCLVPDVLGTLSVATLDNRFENTSYAGSTLDGMDRARLFRHVGIRFGDVEPAGEVGRIAMAALRQDLPVAKVERWRRYE